MDINDETYEENHPLNRRSHAGEDCRLLPKPTTAWVLTTLARPFHTEAACSQHDSFEKAREMAFHYKKKNPNWFISITDPLGVERELKFVPAWIHVEPEPRCCDDVFCGHPLPEAWKNYWEWEGIFQEALRAPLDQGGDADAPL